MKNDNDVFSEELVQSPGRTATRNFLKKRLSVIGIAVFLAIFGVCFIFSFILPIDLNYSDSERQNLPPSYNYLSLPKELTNNAKMVDFGSTFGAGIDRDGKFYMWGTMSDTVSKVKTDLPADMKPLKLVTCGLDHIVAIAEDNTIYTWGNNRLNITSVNPAVAGKNITALQAGYQSTLALDDTGRLYFWGNASMFSYKPSPEDQGHFTAFALNIATAIALKDDGTVVCLDAKDSHFKNIPDRVQGRAVGVASTDKTAAALLDDGTVVTWGSFAAASYTVPEEIQGRVKDIDGGKTHYTVLLDDGTVYSWGENMFSQAAYPRVSNVARINTAYYQNAAVDPDGKVTVWGQKGYLMGTDALGRDVLTRLVYGGRVTLTVGFISVLISAIIGIIIGGLSGYFGGKVDMFLMRFAEVVSSIPQLPLMMILSAVVVSAISETMRVIMIMFILGVLNWPGLARLARAQILSERENEFVTAAKAMGIRERVIIFRHILPNVLPVVLVSITLNMATCLLIESSLSFLGFGVREPTPTWGNMLNSSMNSVVIRKYWWRWVFPSLALGLTTISINIMGDGLRDAIDPKSNDR